MLKNTAETAIKPNKKRFRKNLSKLLLLIFLINFSTYSENIFQKITSGNPRNEDHLGSSVDSFGDWAIVGASGKDLKGQDSGAFYIYKYENNQWQIQNIQAPPGLSSFCYLGESVAISDSYAVIGAPGYQGKGAVFIYELQLGNWVYRQTLHGYSFGENFGYSVDISNNKIVVGAPGNQGRGRVYFYEFMNGYWNENFQATSFDGPQNADQFGFSIAIFEDSVIIGAPGKDHMAPNTGAVYTLFYQNGRWNYEDILYPSSIGPNFRFGESVAISNGQAIIGAPNTDFYGPESGVAYLFKYDFNAGPRWQERGILHSPNTQAFDRFGSTVSISGNTAIVGAPTENMSGAVSMFETSDGNIWNFKERYLNQIHFPGYGSAIAISNGSIIIGSPEDDQNGFMAGAFYISKLSFVSLQKVFGMNTSYHDDFGISVGVYKDTAIIGVKSHSNFKDAYIFKYENSTWIERSELRPMMQMYPYDAYGASVAIYKNIAVVGAPNRMGSGMVYIFEYNGFDWMPITTLTSNDLGPKDQFGACVDIFNNTIMVGAPNKQGGGAVYIFERLNGSLYNQMAKFTAWDGGMSGDNFGASVALDGTRGVIGASRKNYTGSVYVIEKIGNWMPQAIIQPINHYPELNFGCSVDISNDNIVVGAIGGNQAKGPFTGEAYVFNYKFSKWIQTQTLNSPISDFEDYFGNSVAISGNKIIIGAYGELNSGAAYLFETSDGNLWNQTQKYKQPNGQANASFAYSVDIDGGTFIIGSYGDDERGPSAGATYISPGPKFPNNNPPVFTTNSPVFINCDEDNSPNSFQLTLSATDLDADPLTWIISKGPKFGNARVYPNYNSKKIAYFPNANWSGKDSFIVSVDDGKGASANMTVNVSVSARNDPPVCSYKPSFTGAFMVGEALIPTKGVWDDSKDIPPGTLSYGYNWYKADDSLGSNSLLISSTPNYIISSDNTEKYIRLKITAGNYGTGLPLQVSSTAYSSWMYMPSTSDYRSQKIIAFDGTANDNFAYSVAISGDWAIIGSYGDNDNGTNSGSAYIYHFINSKWKFLQKIKALDGASYDNFGISTAINGNQIAVGAYNDDDKGYNSGSAYIFEYNGTTWLQTQKITALDGASWDSFGNSIAMSENTIVIGANGDDDKGYNSGAAYIFEKEGNTWLQKIKLLATDGASWDYFASSVAISGNTVLVGVFRDDDKGYDSGSVYVYEKNSGIWSQTKKLLASDGLANDNFGFSIGVSDDKIIVGAQGDDDQGNNSGSAYIFLKEAGTWVEKEKLLAPDGVGNNNFAVSVAIAGNTISIGAYNDNLFTNAGAMYVYQYNGTSWINTFKHENPDPASNDFFGHSVATTGRHIVTGIYGDDDRGSYTGAAYFISSTHNENPIFTEQSPLTVICDEDNNPTPFTLTLNASDIDGDLIKWSISSQAANGIASVSGTGKHKQITYIPSLNYNGNDSFIVKIEDKYTGFNYLTVNVTINPINDAPVAYDQEIFLSNSRTVDISLYANDIDTTSTNIVYEIVTQPSFAENITLSNNIVTYTMKANNYNIDTFTFRAYDGQKYSNIATATINFADTDNDGLTDLWEINNSHNPSVNDNQTPISVNDTYSIAKNDTLSVGTPGILSNDSDTEGNLSVILKSNISSGTLTLNIDGSFIYTPALDFIGTVLFTYRASDGNSESFISTVTINVNNVFYVKKDATGLRNGSSWIDAYHDLNTVLALTTLQSNNQIWVATGTYLPTLDNDRTKSFVLPEGIELYGGFIGTETTLEERDLKNNHTILSGDLNQDDNSGGSNAENSKNVVKIINNNVIIDGFTITAGNGANYGAGIYYKMAKKSQISNCTIKDNNAYYGAGIYINDSTVNINNTTISNNQSSGGAIYNCDKSILAISNSTIKNNFTLNNAAGIYNSRSTLNISNSMIYNNSAENGTYLAGGIYNASQSNLNITNSIIYNNSTKNGIYSAGGIYNDYQSNLNIINSTVTCNRTEDAYYSSAGIYNTSSLTIRNSILWNNKKNSLPDQIYLRYNATLTLANSCIEGGVSGITGSGTITNNGGIIEADPQFIDASNPLGIDGLWGTYDDGLQLKASSPYIDFGDNSIILNENSLDVSDNPRIINGRVDLGAYERPKTGPMPPTTNSDIYSIDEDKILNIKTSEGILANDFDDGGLINAVLKNSPSNGSLLLNPDGSFTYTPNPNFYGKDSFTYYANDGVYNSLETSVTINVLSRPDPPILNGNLGNINLSLPTTILPLADNHFTHVDLGKSIELQLINYNKALLTVELNETIFSNSTEITLTKKGNNTGEAIIILRANADGLTVDDSFTVKVGTPGITVTSNIPNHGTLRLPIPGQTTDFIVNLSETANITVNDQFNKTIITNTTANAFSIPIQPTDSTATSAFSGIKHIYTVHINENTANPISYTFGFNIDSVLPTLNANPPSGKYNKPLAITLNSDDTDISLKEYSLNDGINFQTFQNALPINISKNTVLYVRATDTAGNIGPIKTMVYTFNNMPDAPIITAFFYDTLTEKIKGFWTDPASAGNFRVYSAINPYDLKHLEDALKYSYPPPAYLRVIDGDANNSNLNFTSTHTPMSGVSYIYCVTAIDSQGVESAPSLLSTVDMKTNANVTNDINKALSKAVQWLDSQQTIIGYWGDDSTDKLIATSAVLNALIKNTSWRKNIANQNKIQRATACLEGLYSKNTESLARAIDTLQRLGKSTYGKHLKLDFNAYNVETATNIYNPVGWGLVKRYYPDPLHTALSLIAKRGAFKSDLKNIPSQVSAFLSGDAISLINNAVMTDNLMKSSSTVNNSYSYSPSGIESTYVSSYVYQALGKNRFSVLNKQYEWIITPKDDGSFNNSILDTATILLNIPITDLTIRTNAREYLKLKQLANGSWKKNPTLTGICLEALTQPDVLLIKGTAPINAAILNTFYSRAYNVIEILDTENLPINYNDMALIFISSDVNISNISSQIADLANTHVPIINTNASLYIGLKIVNNSTNSGTLDATAIDIVNSQHILSAGYINSTPIYTVPSSMTWAKTNKDAITIATIPSDPNKATIFAYNTRTYMPGGIRAPGRRIGFFRNNTSAISTVTQDLLDAAIQWATFKKEVK